MTSMIMHLLLYHLRVLSLDSLNSYSLQVIVAHSQYDTMMNYDLHVAIVWKELFPLIKR